MTDEATIDPTAPSASPLPPEQLHFTGKAGEYFGIWIVNLLLTIVTLGIYSPWAKVRRLKYFYRHTELAGSSFDFHGKPLRILIGRVIALVMLLAYNISVRAKSPLTIVLLIAFAIGLPWLLRNSFRFRLYNTSWRGTRFHFRGAVKEAYRVFLLNGFLTVITFYMMAPFMHQRLKAYQHNNTWFGNTRGSFQAPVRRFYVLYLVLLVGLIIFGVIVSGSFAALKASMPAPNSGPPQDPGAFLKIIGALYGAAILLGISIWPAFTALITNLVWNNTTIGEHRLECRMAPLTVVWIAASNFVVVLFSVGFMIPWAMVRWTRYRVESMRVLPAGSLQDFAGGEPEDIGAIGEEAASVFDFDISL